MLLCGNKQLPPVVFSINETGPIYEEQEERLQSAVQGLQAQHGLQIYACTL